jgi:ABC-type transport system involved in multi-copper enzyme maturation permease subunit
MENIETSLKFTETENKIRKKWLFWCIKLPCIAYGLVITLAMWAAFISSDFITIIGFILLSLFVAGGVYISYHCAYKKPGTILLLLNMIGILLYLFLTFLNPEKLALMIMSVSFSLFMLTMLFWQLAMLYYSYKLRKINKKMKEKQLIELIASPPYINALSIFSTATNLEELNNQFAKLKTSYATEGSIEALVKAYKQQKKVLKAAKIA